ncbi:hypothetical protein TWF696_005859 [Orbilia brochopaga]|uniref:F-box domain-containing protein n=1 Tax=Orbilia brochopaga TaxID=3140254 RepID=A0AAV9UXH4_9PEZI
MASRKRKLGLSTISTSSMKRLQTLRPRKDAIHPFLNLPHELQLRILSFCDARTLAAVSLVSIHFRELSLRILWESQPVETLVRNFKQLDEHEDLRLAVRHLAVRTLSAPNKSRMSGIAKRLLTRFPKNYLPGLTEFTIEYHTAQSDLFVQIMTSLATHQPRNLKTLNIGALSKWPPNVSAQACIEDKTQDTIIYPKGLTTIRITCSFGVRPFLYDPVKVFDSNADTVTTAELNVSHWAPNFSLGVCPKVKTLSAHQEQYEAGASRELSIKFPNVDRLILNLPQCGIMWPSAAMEREMSKYLHWDAMTSVKSIKLVYSAFFRYGMDRVQCRDSALKSHKYLVEQWVARGRMTRLEKVECWCRASSNRASQPDVLTHSFDFMIVAAAGETEKRVSCENITLFKEEEEELELAKRTKKTEQPAIESAVRVVLE